MNYLIVSNGELYHHGVVGMHWGVRRYQNADGSLKPAGRKRYTEGGEKKQLSDEERAARNAKIKSTAKKVAIGVGVTALVAAGTYAAVKYNNKTMAEAKQIMSDAHKKKIDEYLEQADQKFQQQNFAASMYRQFDRVHQGNTEEAKEWAKAEGKYRTELNKVIKEKNVYDNVAKRHMADKAVQRQAQKEIIKRDIKDTKAKVYSKYREAKGDLPQNVGWYMDRTNKKATKNIANLLGETKYEKGLRELAEKEAKRIQNSKADKRNYNKALMSYIHSSNPEISRAAKKFQDARSKKLDEIYRAQRNRTIDPKEAANKINELMNLDGAFVRSLERSMKANAKF